jgi:hypothetical protein
MNPGDNSFLTDTAFALAVPWTNSKPVAAKEPLPAFNSYELSRTRNHNTIRRSVQA